MLMLERVVVEAAVVPLQFPECLNSPDWHPVITLVRKQGHPLGFGAYYLQLFWRPPSFGEGRSAASRDCLLISTPPPWSVLA